MTRLDDLPLYSFEIALPPATAAGFTGFPYVHRVHIPISVRLIV